MSLFNVGDKIISSNIKRLEDKVLTIGEAGEGSCYYADGPNRNCIIVKGIGAFDESNFYLAPNQDDDDEDDEYYTIIMPTKGKIGNGYEYERIEYVVSHEYKEIGILIHTDSTEYFYPWTFDGGIEYVMVQKGEAV